MSAERLAEIKARVDAATPGPWEFIPAGNCPEVVSPGLHGLGYPLCRVESLRYVTDAAFISHARTDVPDLLATLDAKDEEIARLTERAEAAEIERDEIASAHEALTLEMEAMEGGERPAPKESTP